MGYDIGIFVKCKSRHKFYNYKSWFTPDCIVAKRLVNKTFRECKKLEFHDVLKLYLSAKNAYRKTVLDAKYNCYKQIQIKFNSSNNSKTVFFAGSKSVSK